MMKPWEKEKNVVTTTPRWPFFHVEEEEVGPGAGRRSFCSLPCSAVILRLAGSMPANSLVTMELDELAIKVPA